MTEEEIDSHQNAKQQGESHEVRPWTKKQKLGFEYKQHNTDLPREMSVNRIDGDWTFNFSGKSMDPPEVEMLQRVGGMVVYYEAGQFRISHGNGKELDLVAITPKGWTQKSIQLTSGNYMPPEVHRMVDHYAALDPDRKEIVIGNLNKSTQNSETLGKIILWQTLMARFFAEVGEPWDKNAMETLKDIIEKRRQEVLDALSGKSPDNPEEVALRPFSYAS